MINTRFSRSCTKLIDMNYKWEILNERGQYAIGFVDVIKSIINNKNANIIINYLPQFADKDQKILTTILLEGKKEDWTEGTVKKILYDCEERINRIANFKFRIFNNLEYMTVQIFYIKNIDYLKYGSHGDFSFEEPI